MTTLARSWKTELVPGKQSPFLENRARSWKTELVPGKQSSFLENRARSWKTELVPGKQSSFLENRARSWKTELVPGKQSPFLENRARSWKTELVPGKQSPFLENRDRAWKTEPVPGKQSSFLENRARSWKTELVPGKQSPFLESRARSWKTELVPGKQSPFLESRVSNQKKGGNPGFLGTAAQWTGLLGADERFAVHPIGVTAQLAECTDLEVIDSSHGQASDDGFPGTGDRNRCPGTECTAGAFECVTHIKGENALLTFGFHNDLAAAGPAINEVELRFRQRLRRRPGIRNGRETAGGEDRRIIVARALDVMPELRIHLDHGEALLVFRLDDLLTAICSVNNQRSEAVDTGFVFRQIEWCSRKCRIVQKAVVRQSQRLHDLRIQHTMQTKLCLDLCWSRMGVWHNLPTFLYGCALRLMFRSEEHTSELQSHSFISYAVFC